MVKDGLPTAVESGFDVVGAVVEVEEIRATETGETFECLVDWGCRFHVSDFMGQHVAIEMGEEGEATSDVVTGDSAGIGEKVGWDVA